MVSHGWGADRRAAIGLGRSFQDARIFPTLTVAENIAIGLERHLDERDHLAALLNLPAVQQQEEDVAFTVEDLIELMSLGAFRDKFVAELSTGSRRIVDLAMAIAPSRISRLVGMRLGGGGVDDVGLGFRRHQQSSVSSARPSPAG